MAVKLFFFLVVLELTSSMTPPKTTSGKHFVFTVPIANEYGKARSSDSAWVRFNTEERKAKLIMSFPYVREMVDSTYRHSYCTVWRVRGCMFKFTANALSPSYSGTFLAGKVRASAPISGVVYVTTSSDRSSAMIRLLPQEICSTSYYVSTTNAGFPFIIVMSFDSKTKASITFPKYKKQFNVHCSGNRLCSSDSTVVFRLFPFMVWQLYIKVERACLHNTLVKANRPVYVIAGNTAAKVRKNNLDTGAFSLRPTETWGKVYIIPKFGPDKNPASMTSYRINSKKIPFDYKLFQNRKEHKKTLTNYEHDEIIREFTSPVVISAEVSFGLYQYVGGDGLEVGFLSVVPTEQWSNGGSYFLSGESYPPGMKVSYKRLIFTTADKNKIVVNGDGSIAWESPILYPGTTYNYGILKVGSYPISVYSKEPNGRLVIYKATTPRKGQSNAYYSLSSYFAKIYDERCKRTESLSNDGFDNDCDGLVDEEWKNDKDDDGDGLIDEDYMETPEKPEWTAWTTVCRMNCDGTNYEKKVRECKPSVVKEFTCEGEDETCDSGQKCPAACLKVIESQCKCKPRCRKCLSPNSHRCSECEFAFSGNYCLIPCPAGWTGKDCASPPRREDLHLVGTKIKLPKEIIEDDDEFEFELNESENVTNDRETSAPDDEEEESDGSSIWPWVVAVLVGLALVILVCFMVRGRRKTKRVDEKEDSTEIEPSEGVESSKGEASESEFGDDTSQATSAVDSSSVESERD